MRITATMTISLPAAMLRQFEEVRNAENRTRYELVREALWHYFETRYAVVQPTRKELRLIAPGRATLARGECDRSKRRRTVPSEVRQGGGIISKDRVDVADRDDMGRLHGGMR